MQASRRANNQRSKQSIKQAGGQADRQASKQRSNKNTKPFQNDTKEQISIDKKNILKKCTRQPCRRKALQVKS